jgi:hypothetical protein
MHTANDEQGCAADTNTDEASCFRRAVVSYLALKVHSATPANTMSASKLIKKLFKRGDKTHAGASSTLAATSTSPPPSPTTAAMLHTPLPQTASRLLSLPGEIRNKIYAYALYPSLSTITLHRAPQTVLPLHIFAICRQIRSEAISALCSSKAFSLFGLRTANAFFAMIGDGASDIRYVTIHCETDWRSESEGMAGRRVELLRYLELATSLRSLRLVVGDFPFTHQDELQLGCASSVGSQFLYAIRSVVDRERAWAEEERVVRERFLTLCDQMDALQAVRSLKEKLKKEHEERTEKVFQVGKRVSLQGDVKNVMLPLRVSEYLRKAEEDSRGTCCDGMNYGDDIYNTSAPL